MAFSAEQQNVAVLLNSLAEVLAAAEHCYENAAKIGTLEAKATGAGMLLVAEKLNEAARKWCHSSDFGLGCARASLDLRGIQWKPNAEVGQN